MMKWLAIILMLALMAFVSPYAMASTTKVDLLLGAETVRAGDTVMAGVRLKMEFGWHTYWRNAGDSGFPSSIDWELPPGVTAGAIQWPVPEKLPAEDLTTYVYDDEVVLLVPLTVASNAAPGPLTIKGTVRWLECNTQCLMGHGDVQGTLTVGSETKVSANATTLSEWEKKLPTAGTNLNARAWWENETTNDVRALVIEWAGASATGADFYPYSKDGANVQSVVTAVPADAGRIRIRKMLKRLDGNWPTNIAGILVEKKPAGGVMGYEVDLPITKAQMAGAITSSTSVVTPTSSEKAVAPVESQSTSVSLASMLLFAFLGGLILNIMPCVLPVIALKILGFVSQGGNHPARVRNLGFIYAAGVLVSFLALAALVIGVKVAGHHAGWGMQFGNPEFLVVMTVLITLVALNLFGVFEINLSGKVMGKSGELSMKEGPAGAFFNGVLATILATPCSAPFLGAALGFAFTQSYPVIVVIFLTVGVGLAAPYVVLSWNPALLKALPKPGAWMEKFKVAMGFPMLATAVWLFDLTTVHYGRRVFWLALFLVVVAMAAWIYGEFVQRGRTRKGLALATVIAILCGGILYVLEGQLMWRSPLNETAMTVTAETAASGIQWQPWSAQAVAAAQAAGHPVLVDFTADWCLVCQVNAKTSVNIARVKEKLKDINGLAMLADYTKLPVAITDELNRFGRATVPLVVVFPSDPAKAPEVLPDGYLTPGIVLAALDKASGK